MSGLSTALPSLRDVPTPALVVDEPVLRANIEQMAAFARDAGISLRPHAKTHKSSEIARLQVAAGAIGIACATVAEAEALWEDGIDNLLVTCAVAEPAKAARLAALNRTAPLSVVVDHPMQVDLLQAALHPEDPAMRILVDVDLGQKRTGIVDIADAVTLAVKVRTGSRMVFGGLQGFGGHIQHVADPAARREAAEAASTHLRAIRNELRAEGIACEIVSGSGTGASEYDARGCYTELQVGSYVFMDADYRRILTTSDGGETTAQLPYGPALFVLATVVSANRPGQVTVDAGVKALAFNGPAPDLLLGLPDGARYQFAGDEHGIIALPEDAPAPPVGTRVLIAATHCDPTANLYAAYLFVGADGGTRRVPILGRH